MTVTPRTAFVPPPQHTTRPTLRGRFGTPDELDERGAVVSAFWRRGGAEAAFTRVGASSSLNLSRRR